MYRKLEGVHMGFLRRISRQRAVQQKDRTHMQVAAETVLEKLVTHTLGTYIDRSQATVVEWVVLRPILEVFARETGYEEGERRWDPWLRQTAPRKHISATLKDISSAAKERGCK